MNSGLILYINTSADDYFYATEPYVGLRVSFCYFFRVKFADVLTLVYLIYVLGDAFESWLKS